MLCEGANIVPPPTPVTQLTQLITGVDKEDGRLCFRALTSEGGPGGLWGGIG